VSEIDSELDIPSPKVASMVGVLAPLRKRASFVTPVFASDGQKWLQKLKGGRIEGFERLDVAKEIKLLQVSDKVSQISIAQDAEPVSAFAFDLNDVIAAPRRELAQILSTRLDEIQSDPLIRLDVVEFIGDHREIRAAVSAAAAEISAVDAEVAYSFYCDQRNQSKRLEAEESEKIRNFTLSLLLFFKSYSRYLHVGEDGCRRKLRYRYQRSLENLTPLVFDLELAQVMQARILGLGRESAQYLLEIDLEGQKVPEWKIQALTRTGMSRAAAIRFVEHATKRSPYKRTSDVNLLLAARRAIFSADRALYEQARLSLKKLKRKSASGS
jgi:hypothetical protein